MCAGRMRMERQLGFPLVKRKLSTRIETEVENASEVGLRRGETRQVSDHIANINSDSLIPLFKCFFSGVIIMTTSKRLADRKIEKFDKNITKRGFVPETTTKKGKDYPVGPILLGFFVFVVIGSSLFQIIRTATSGGMA
ncbi:Stress-associated endoplasmic reticulum protein [Raphanus sativus]|nr:Stress-associated endoplasmic reticulum protein [Raphanus sativus]